MKSLVLRLRPPNSDTKFYFKNIKRFLKFGAKVFNPFSSKEGEPRKLSIRAIMSLLIHFVMLLIIAAYIKENPVNLLELTENSAVFLVNIRNVIYIIFNIIWSSKTIVLVNRIIIDREATLHSPDEWKLTLRYSKIEYIGLVLLFVSASAMVVVFDLGVIMFDITKYRLPYNFYIIYLPFEGVSVNWLLNYLLQALFAIVAAFILIAYFPMTMLFMHQTCWVFDNLVLSVENFGASLEIEENLKNDEMIRKEIKSIIVKSYAAIEWRNEVQELLKFNFLMELSSLAYIFCLLSFTVTVDPSATFVVYFFTPTFFGQLFLYCWMGSRVEGRIENYAVALYALPWYTMKPQHRKDIRQMLAMAQRVKGFNGIFNEVGMEVFGKIVQFTFSLLTLLQSMN